MRVLVTGGRDYADQRRVDEVLDRIHADEEIDCLIHGDARGADSLSADWARRNGVPADPYPADWDNIEAMPCRIGIGKNRRPYNKLAGFTRNLRMILQGRPHLCVVLPGGAGTADCRAKALRNGVAVMDVEP